MLTADEIKAYLEQRLADLGHRQMHTMWTEILDARIDELRKLMKEMEK